MSGAARAGRRGRKARPRARGQNRLPESQTGAGAVRFLPPPCSPLLLVPPFHLAQEASRRPGDHSLHATCPPRRPFSPSAHAHARPSPCTRPTSTFARSSTASTFTFRCIQPSGDTATQLRHVHRTRLAKIASKAPRARTTSPCSPRLPTTTMRPQLVLEGIEA